MENGSIRYMPCRGEGISIGEGEMEEVMRTGNVPIAMPGKPGSLSGGGGGIVPPTLLDERRLPQFYLDAIYACGATSITSLPNTALVYNMMVTSNLPRPVLSYIWSAVNRSLPGQLTRAEFFSCLALIALAQKEESLAALSSMSVLPIPILTPSFIISSSSTNSSMNTPSILQPNISKQRIMEESLGPSCSPSSSSSRLSQFIPSALLASSFTLSNQSKTPSSSSSRNDLLDLSGYIDGVSEEMKKKKENDDRRKMIWDKTMNGVEQIVNHTLSIFDGRTNDVIREVCRTERGDDLICCVGGAIRVGKRIGRIYGSNDMNKRIEEIEKKWIRFNNMRIHPQIIEDDDYNNTNICSICNVNGSSISYGGCSYHTECANLWVNIIDSVLPSHISSSSS